MTASWPFTRNVATRHPGSRVAP